MLKCSLCLFYASRYEIERNYNPSESSKRKCIKTEINPMNENGYNVHFNNTWMVGGTPDGKCG